MQFWWIFSQFFIDFRWFYLNFEIFIEFSGHFHEFLLVSSRFWLNFDMFIDFSMKFRWIFDDFRLILIDFRDFYFKFWSIFSNVIQFSEDYDLISTFLDVFMVLFGNFTSKFDVFFHYFEIFRWFRLNFDIVRHFYVHLRDFYFRFWRIFPIFRNFDGIFNEILMNFWWFSIN